jgi:putative effector of murein hydrolase
MNELTDGLASAIHTLSNTLVDSPSTNAVLAIVLTLGAFMAGNRAFALLRSPVWLPPVMISACLLGLTLMILKLNYQDYRDGAQWLTVLLGPATVALGVPLYQQMHHIRALWRPILFTLPIAALLASGYAMLIAGAFGASPEVIASVAPKSVTAPIAIGITEQLGGSVPLIMGGLLITGVMATVFVDLAVRWMNIRDPRIIGFALGLNGHAIGTARAFELGISAGAFASLGMGLTGIFTALALPLVLGMFGF